MFGPSNIQIPKQKNDALPFLIFAEKERRKERKRNLETKQLMSLCKNEVQQLWKIVTDFWNKHN